MNTESTESILPQARLSLMERARAARWRERDNELEEAARALVASAITILGEPDLSPSWGEWDGKRVPVVVIDGLTFSYYSDWPLGIYVHVLCQECGGATRRVIHTISELADAVETPAECAKCATAREAREGVAF